jgi:hypothetical protein
MSDDSMLTPPAGVASHVRVRPGRLAPALLGAALIVAGSVVVGVAGGAVWAAAAPRVVYQVYTLNPPTAYATNPETSAFIAVDGWYCFIALVGGALIGLLGYLFAVRRYGPVPMAGIVVGSAGAAFITAWLGHALSGGAGFDQVLATSRPGALLRAPIVLGSHGALAFWPLGAAGVAGGIELVHVLRARHQETADRMPMPGMETFGASTYLAPPANGQSHLRQTGNGHTPVMRQQDTQGASGASEGHEGGSGRLGP